MTKRPEELKEWGVTEFAIRTRQTRVRYGYTQEEFARQCGLCTSAVNHIELGVATPSDRSYNAIVKLLREWEKNPPEKRPDMRGRWNFARDALRGSR